jgi:hypothetical protein
LKKGSEFGCEGVGKATPLNTKLEGKRWQKWTKSLANCVQFCVQVLKTGAPGAIPTRDLPLRRRTLYAAELREHDEKINNTVYASHLIRAKQK